MAALEAAEINLIAAAMLEHREDHRMVISWSLAGHRLRGTGCRQFGRRPAG